ncbi:Nrap protein [Lentinus tigrinus ALCF2SS1-7]|uniref:U3 small nucleolar RNA-associated protein 22 n=1 Tax=Lentinus tigrinus ALCF2SS1-6 TaxID=1328759 RepID=A0A5C2SV60_9APHY|nr:Nrap protein [Lentinus tigrinus ALCF2SS1-6]RPD79439.1 Nrap protein [Lentinus tigrinus ALCF2SS1-7]
MSSTLKRKRSGSPGSDSGSDSDASGSGSHASRDEWQGLGAPDSQNAPSSSHVVKPPTGQELRNIKEATDLYRSTSFKFQIDALLPNVRPKYQHSQPLDAFLLSLHKLLVNASPISPQHPLQASRSLSKKGIAVPYIRPLPTEDTNWKVAFEPPTEVVLVGSWATKTAVKGKDSLKYQVDVAIAMPPGLFQEKDYLNGRVFQKRAFYLAVVAAALVGPKSTLPCEAFYESTSGDPRCTTLVVEPSGSSKEWSKLNARVRIIPFLPESPIPLQRLSPSRSNLRTHAQDDEAKEEATPIYNSAFMLMNTPKMHLLSVHALAQDIPAFTDALTLLRVWANQRGYGPGTRMCVRGFEGKGMLWASVLELLIHGEEPLRVGLSKTNAKRKPLGKGLSPYQLFKAALDFLARHGFGDEAVFVKAQDGHRFPPGSYSSHEAVFVDSSSSVNLLAGVPLSSLDLLRHDAQATLQALDHSSLSEDPFQTVFLQDHRDIFGRFDVVLRVDVSSAVMRAKSAHLVADYGSVYNALLANLTSVLRRGLGNRAKAIAVLHPSSDVRPLSQALPSSSSVVYLGIILDTEHAFRLVDHGPAAEEQESESARQFREFWGDKAELRRFKDGSITESVVWDVKSADERVHVPALIVKHLLQRHLGIGADAVQTWQNQFDALLKAPESIRSLYQARGASIGFKTALTAFDTLVKQIKALDEELPLAILNVSPVSAGLRYTEAFVPVAIPLASRPGIPSSASYLPAMEVVVEFEKSGRWPDDLRAIQKIKLAFFERLATCLMGAVKGLQANVVLGNGPVRKEIQDEVALDIVTPDGWAFRARIWHDREATLLDRVIDPQPHVPKAVKKPLTPEEARDRQAAIEAKEVYTRRFLHAPRHHRAVAALSHRSAAFAGTIRLVKRWFAAHWLLRSHVREEAVELLCSYVFLRTGARVQTEGAAGFVGAGMPGTKERGFAMVLEFLKDWDWTKGLVVPLEFGDRDASVTPDATKPPPSTRAAWSLATEFDPEGHMWTSHGPDAIVARRVTVLAKAAWDGLCGLESGDGDVKRLFHHPTDDYDFIVEVDPSLSPRYYQNVDADPSVWTVKGKYANASSKDPVSAVMPGFDPLTMFYDDLKRTYEDSALLFYDVLGGTRIGGVWLPNLRAPRPFRVLGGFSSIPVLKDSEKPKEKDRGFVVLNENALLGEIGRIGYGYIVKITQKGV